jgi:hypothetical protein
MSYQPASIEQQGIQRKSVILGIRDRLDEKWFKADENKFIIVQF